MQEVHRCNICLWICDVPCKGMVAASESQHEQVVVVMCMLGQHEQGYLLERREEC